MGSNETFREKLNGNYTMMLCNIFNKSCKQHATKHRLSGHRPAILQNIQNKQDMPGIVGESRKNP